MAMAALRSPFEASCPLPTNTRQDKTQQNYQAGTCGAHTKQWRLIQRLWLSKTRQLANCLWAHIILLYIVENQTTTTKALQDMIPDSLAFCLKKEQMFLIPTRMCCRSEQLLRVAKGVSCAAKAWTELLLVHAAAAHPRQEGIWWNRGGTGTKIQKANATRHTSLYRHRELNIWYYSLRTPHVFLQVASSGISLKLNRSNMCPKWQVRSIR